MSRSRIVNVLIFLAALASLALGPRPLYAAPVLTIQPITWNTIGLDSNNVNVGPNIFQVGARVCNVGDETATNVTTTFVQDGAINPYISLQGSSTLTLPALPPGPTSHPPGNTGPTPANCADFYYNVLISRTSAAYDTTQLYHIEATADGLGTVSTPTNRELYVEHLISQNRNEVTSFTGPTQVVVGQTYFYTVTAKTATNGYEQLVTSVDFPNILFQTLAVTVTYTAPPNATNNAVYADACGWDPNIGPTPPKGTYRSCVGPANYPGGKAGGNITMVYKVLILSAGTATLTPIIYDFSGSSYHYNSNYGLHVLSVVASDPTAANVISFAATPRGGAILVTWETASEVDNLGFHLYRRESGTEAYTRLNETLIPSRFPGQGQGATYDFVDDRVRGGVTYEYLLEEVDTVGMRTSYGPVAARALYIVFLPTTGR